MANPNRSPQKGFIKEIAKNPRTTNAKEAFTYSKPVVRSQSASMNTPKRLSEHKAVAPAKSNIVNETAQHIKIRRDK